MTPVLLSWCDWLSCLVAEPTFEKEKKNLQSRPEKLKGYSPCSLMFFVKIHFLAKCIQGAKQREGKKGTK